jgi:ribosomal-protein-alanine N-acetyltransferase
MSASLKAVPLGGTSSADAPWSDDWPALSHRAMTVADLDAVLAVEAVAYGFPWTRGNFIDSLAAGYRCELRTTDQGDLVGYSVTMTSTDELHLLNITVSPELQGRGHAAALMHRLLEAARAQGLKSLWLEVRPSNAPARRLYERFGLREVGLRRGYYPAGMGRREDAIVMNRLLVMPHHGLD